MAAGGEWAQESHVKGTKETQKPSQGWPTITVAFGMAVATGWHASGITTPTGVDVILIGVLGGSAAVWTLIAAGKMAWRVSGAER